MKARGLVIIIFFVLPSCDIMEMRGFVTSYVDVNTRFEQSLEWNRQQGYRIIEIQQSDYQVHVMGDSHVGETENLDRFFEEALNEGAVATVLAGDITTGNEEDYITLSEHLPPDAPFSVFGIAGNHDLYFEGWQHFYDLFGSSSYYFEVHTSEANDIYICLDTGGGTLGSSQLKWLKMVLKGRDDYRYCTVIMHNNIFRLKPTASTNPMVEEIRVLTDLFLRHDVNIVVNAHDHKRNTDILGNTTYIIMDALQDANPDASYLKLTISEEKIDYTFTEI